MALRHIVTTYYTVRYAILPPSCFICRAILIELRENIDTEQTSKKANEQTSKRANEQTSKRANKRTSKQANKQTSEQANKQTSKQAF